MLYPSIQELLKATAGEEGEKLNKYSLVMTTAKCARVITNQYVEERKEAERKIANKESDKDIASLITREYRDEKAVKNALRELKNGEFQVFLPGEEGYEESMVIIEDYKEPEKYETSRYVKPEKNTLIEEEAEEEVEEEIEEDEYEETFDEDFSFFDDEKEEE